MTARMEMKASRANTISSLRFSNGPSYLGGQAGGGGRWGHHRREGTGGLALVVTTTITGLISRAVCSGSATPFRVRDLSTVFRWSFAGGEGERPPATDCQPCRVGWVDRGGVCRGGVLRFCRQSVRASSA